MQGDGMDRSVQVSTHAVERGATVNHSSRDADPIRFGSGWIDSRTRLVIIAVNTCYEMLARLPTCHWK